MILYQIYSTDTLQGPLCNLYITLLFTGSCSIEVLYNPVYIMDSYLPWRHTSILRTCTDPVIYHWHMVYMMTSRQRNASVILVTCEGNPLMADGFPAQNACSVDICFSLLLAWESYWINNRLSRDIRTSIQHHRNVHRFQDPLLLTWLNFNPSMDM